jgi:hypothetical protein
MADFCRHGVSWASSAGLVTFSTAAIGVAGLDEEIRKNPVKSHATKKSIRRKFLKIRDGKRGCRVVEPDHHALPEFFFSNAYSHHGDVRAHGDRGSGGRQQGDHREEAY